MKSIQIIDDQRHKIKQESNSKERVEKNKKKKPSKSLQNLNICPTKRVSHSDQKRSATQNSEVIHSMFPKIRQESFDFIETLKLLKRRRHSSFILGESFREEKNIPRKGQLAPSVNRISNIKLCQGLVEEFLKHASNPKQFEPLVENKASSITFKRILDSLCIARSNEPGSIDARSKSVPLKCKPVSQQWETKQVGKSKNINLISKEYMSIKSILSKEEVDEINVKRNKIIEGHSKISKGQREKKMKLNKLFPQSKMDNKGISPWHSYYNASYYGPNV